VNVTSFAIDARAATPLDFGTVTRLWKVSSGLVNTVTSFVPEPAGGTIANASDVFTVVRFTTVSHVWDELLGIAFLLLPSA